MLCLLAHTMFHWRGLDTSTSTARGIREHNRLALLATPFSNHGGAVALFISRPGRPAAYKAV